MANIEWDVAKLKAYFDECQATYNEFLAMSDSLIQAFQAFVDDDTHTGEEADSAKAFVKERQIPLIIDIVDDIQLLEDLQNNLMQSFAEEVDSASNAIIKTDFLDKITLDFGEYEDNLKDIGEKIASLAQDLNATCSEVGSYTVPDYMPYYKAMEELASNDGTTGLAPETKKKLIAFDNAHANDVSVSAYQTLYDTIMSNIEAFLSGVGDGRYYDIRTYNGTKGDLKWKTPLDYLDGAALAEYKQFVEDMHAYLKGKKERCEVYKYDPVNMCNGNYINEHTDITLGGRYTIEFKRFYNAISNECGALGLGWTHNYNIRIYDNKDDSKLKIVYGDGSEGSFKKVKDYYVEEHGEPGILEKLDNGYIIRQDDGSYEKFDWSGRLSELGDLDGAHTGIHYQLLNDRTTRRLREVILNNGNKLTFAYVDDEDNKELIKSVTDQAGRSVCYAYDDNKRLVEIQELDGAVRKFTYTEDGKIKDVINSNGIVAITNEYDGQSRTIKQSFPDGSVMTYDYDDINKTTTATEQNGNKVIYTHDDLGRHTATEYYDGTERYTYNVRNQKTSFTDKRGNTTRFAYDNKGHLTKILDAAGNKTFITYRADGKPMAVKGPKGEEYKYTYDLKGKLFELRNPLGEHDRFYYENGNLYKTRNANDADTFFEYDKNGNVVKITDADGVVTKYEYDSLNRVVTTITADGSKTTFEYDIADRIVKATDALGNTREYTYDAMGKVTSVKEADGTFKSYEMNVMGRVSKITDEAGFVTEITYNVMGKQEKVCLPNGGVIKYEYDPLMRLTKVTDPEGRTSGYEYDKNGNVTAEYLGDIKVRSLEYDILNRITKEIDALGHEKTYTYDENGNLTAVVDTLGNKYTRDYDLLGRVVAETDPLGNETTYTYTKLGDIASITDAAGRTRSFEYTGGGKLKAIYFCDRLEQEINYDNVGRIVSRSFADGYKINYSYDVLSRVSKVEGSDGRTVAYEYDAMGRATRVADGRSTTLYTYTATGRIKSVVDALGNETAYTYDALDNLKSVQRAEGKIDNKDDRMPVVGEDGHVTIYTYDLSGQLTKITDALGQEETYEYDQYGRLKNKKDRDEYVTSYTYNNVGAVTNVGYSDGRSVTFAYNELNQLNEINDWLGKTTLENDILGRLTKVTDYQNRTVGYDYNSIGEKTKLVYPDGRVAAYTYDAEGKLSGISGNGEETTYSYDELGRLSMKLLPNGVSTEYSYLPGGNLKSMESSDKEGVLDKYFYTYDNAGLISGINRNRRGLDAVSGQYDYKYDAIGRLTESSHNGQVKSAYEYDAFGNRTSLVEENTKTAYKYDVLDRLIEAKELNNSQAIVKTYSYDKRGNQTKEFVDGLLQKTFTFDATNMLAKVTDATKGELENQYNGLGFRVVSIRPEEKIEYLCDLSRDYYNLLERTVNGETESFVYDNNVISMSKAGNSYYYLQDELGSPMYMTGTDGVAVSSYAFDDFGRNVNPFTGKIKEKKHGYTTNGNIIQPFAFTGYQEDEVSGLKFAQARFYSAENGRFVGEDQVRGFTGIPETLNHYLYCWNDSKNFIDKDGKFANILIGAGIGAAIGGVGTIVSSISKGEPISIKEVAKNAAIGAASGAVIATGVGAVAALAEATVVSSAAATAMTTCAGIVGTASATIETGRQIAAGEKIDMFKISSAGAAGAASGMVTGSPVGRLGAGILNGGISAVQSIANDIHDGKSAGEIAIDAGINTGIGFIGGLIGGAGAMNGVGSSTEITNVLFSSMNKSHLFVYGRMIIGKAAEDYVKRAAISGLIKGIGWTLGVTISQEVYERCVEE